MNRERCRACGPSRNIWARQCYNAAKTTRTLDGPEGPSYAVCGVHANARYAYVYRPRNDSRYELPVMVTVSR
jgi:hypothetical protein